MESGDTTEEIRPLLPERTSNYGSSSIEVEPDAKDDGLENHSEPIPIYKVITGILLVILAGFLFTASNIIQKFYVPTLTFWQLLFHRAIVQFLLMVSVCAAKGCMLNHGLRQTFLGPAGVRIRTVGQGILGGVLLLCMFHAVKHVPLGNSSAIMFCTPVFTFMFAPCMLREQCGIYRSTIAVLMVSGVVLITRPPFIFGPGISTNGTNVSTTPEFNHQPTFEVGSTEGYICAVGVPLLSAVISLLTRQCKHVPAYLLMFWFGTGALIVSSFSVTVLHPRHLFNLSRLEWMSTGVIIVFGILGNLCYTFAVRWVSPTKANVFRSFEVILNFVLQIHFEHTNFYPENAVGIIFLVSAVIVMAFEKEVLSRYAHFRFL